ncbi:MAG TPA: hypothetical protein DIT64_03660 [Verrucomicrobiales bacterium]|nr:hypothetical protein [Verrucomicrobiales bacterium]
MDTIPSYRQRLPHWLNLWMPLFILVYPFILAVPALNWEKDLYREYGLIENLTVAFLAAAIVLSLRSLRRADGLVHRAWLLLLAAGAFVFLGEEISWGQHYFKWVTPEEWKEMNRQGETNLHNIKGGVEYFFTKVAREGLSLATIIGGILVPLHLRRKKADFTPGTLWFWVWPSLGGALTALLSATIRLPNSIAHQFGKVDCLPPFLGEDIGEMKECYLALFILLYALTQFRITRRLPAAGTS